MNILKFGGTSMADHTTWKQVIDIVAATDKPALVVSATSGTTNSLLNSAPLAILGDLESALSIADELETKHHTILESLLGDYALPDADKIIIRSDRQNHVNALIARSRNYLTGIHTLGELTDRSINSMGSIGERLSSYLT